MPTDLMGNHYHLLIETPEANLSRGMRQLNGIFTQTFNRRHGRSGHLFQGRYKAILVDKESYLLELCRYIVLNPVAAHMVKTPEDWKWSSFLPTAGLAQFAEKKGLSQKRYAAFVYDGLGRPSPWEKLRGGVLLGDDAFAENLRPSLEKIRDAEVPRNERLSSRPALEELFTIEGGRRERDEAAYAAHVKWGYYLKEIGAFFGVHYATVSKMVKRAEG